MYRYFKSRLSDEYVVVFDNPRCGPVIDKRFASEQKAQQRVNDMNKSLLRMYGLR